MHFCVCCPSMSTSNKITLSLQKRTLPASSPKPYTPIVRTAKAPAELLGCVAVEGRANKHIAALLLGAVAEETEGSTRPLEGDLEWRQEAIYGCCARTWRRCRGARQDRARVDGRLCYVAIVVPMLCENRALLQNSNGFQLNGGRWRMGALRCRRRKNRCRSEEDWSSEISGIRIKRLHHPVSVASASASSRHRYLAMGSSAVILHIGSEF
jgi:hypothetical protein